MPVAAAVAIAMLADRAFPQRKRERLAAHVDREAVPGRVDIDAAEVIRRRHEFPRRLRAMG